jgi:hypothetical protein
MDEPRAMDDARREPGMPELDRQALRASAAHTTARPSLRDLPIRSVPETAPTPLQRHYVNLSVIALVCGAIAISAVEFGAPVGSTLVKVCVLVGAPILAATTADASVRVWRAAGAWMPVDRGKALFRYSWVAAMGVLLVVLTAVAVTVLVA